MKVFFFLIVCSAIFKFFDLLQNDLRKNMIFAKKLVEPPNKGHFGSSHFERLSSKKLSLSLKVLQLLLREPTDTYSWLHDEDIRTYIQMIRQGDVGIILIGVTRLEGVYVVHENQ